VQLALDRDRAGGVLVEHRDVALLGRPRGGDAERAGELAQVVGVLDHVEGKHRLIERPVGESGDEQVLTDRPIRRVDARPQLRGQRAGAVT
jgi:hypothetical protein